MEGMVTAPPPAPASRPIPAQTRLQRYLGKTRVLLLSILVILLLVCIVFSWMTRDSMEQLSFLRSGQSSRTAAGQKALVDLRPWQTAEALAPLAITNEEKEFADEAQRLADHEVDQAFATALRKATAQVQKQVLAGPALEIAKRVDDLQDLVKQDQQDIKDLTPPPGSTDTDNADDLEIAKAQLGLDSDQLNDAQDDLARASGDDRAKIQSELQEHEAAMKAYDTQPHAKGQVAVLSAAQYRTLAQLIKAWNSQNRRSGLIEQAMQQAQADVTTLTAEHNTLEKEANDAAAKDLANPPATQAAKLASIRDRRGERQLLSLYDDRIQTQQQLAAVYGKWRAQVAVQHRILLHLILRQFATVAVLLILVILFDALLQRLLSRPALDRRRMLTLRTILQLGIQLVGVLVVLLFVFGSPNQMPTILGLATAGLTVVLQDFILAFFGWFILMGKNGIRVGDWVEINGVGGEVTEIGLFRTTMLETGNWTDKGHPTGRRVTMINSFAIRGQYFNFSTTGQWMWDEIAVTVPADEDAYDMVERIHKAVLKETETDARVAEQEWKRGSRQDGLSQFTAEPTVNLRPSGSGLDILVRYVTRASERFAVRNRLYQKVLEAQHPGVENSATKAV